MKDVNTIAFNCNTVGPLNGQTIGITPGYPLSTPAWKFCPQCGTKLGTDWRFCAECGSPLNQITIWQTPNTGCAPAMPFFGTVTAFPVGECAIERYFRDHPAERSCNLTCFCPKCSPRF